MTKIATGQYLIDLANNSGGTAPTISDPNKCVTYDYVNGLSGFALSQTLQSNQLVKESLITYAGKTPVKITINCSFKTDTLTDANGNTSVASTISFVAGANKIVDTNLTITIVYNYFTSTGSASLQKTITTTIVSGTNTSRSTDTTIDNIIVSSVNIQSVNISPLNSATQTYFINIVITDDNNKPITTTTTTTSAEYLDTPATITYRCNNVSASMLSFYVLNYTSAPTAAQFAEYLNSNNTLDQYFMESVSNNSTIEYYEFNINLWGAPGIPHNIIVSSAAFSNPSLTFISVKSYPSNENHTYTTSDIAIQNITINRGTTNTITLHEYAAT